MSRTNENKLKMKDIATIGIFSALLFVVTMVAGALMGISMVLNMEKKRKHPSPKPRKKHEKPVGEHMGGAFHPKKDGYDGYYDDVLPSDAGKLKEGPDMELVKKVSAVAGVMLLIVILCVVAMYLL